MFEFCLDVPAINISPLTGLTKPNQLASRYLCSPGHFFF